MHNTLIWPVSPDYIPAKANDRDAGYDLRAYIPETEETTTNADLWQYLESTIASAIADEQSTLKILIDGRLLNIPIPNRSYIYLADTVRELRSQILAQMSQPFITILPSSTRVVSAGFKIKLPKAEAPKISVLQIYPRSGLGIKSGLLLANSVGVIDENYCKDDVMLGLYNHSAYLHLISDKTRVAQGLITEVFNTTLVVPTQWETENDRGGGLGSSGVG